MSDLLDVDIFRIYVKSIPKRIDYTEEEIIDLCIKKDNGDREAFNKLYVNNLFLVVKIALSLKKESNVSNIMDFIQVGNIGLITGIKKFDYTKNVKISTYASSWIIQKILKERFINKNFIRIPISINKVFNAVLREQDLFLQKNGRRPSKKELYEVFVSKNSMVTEEMFNSVYRIYSSNFTSLDKTIELDDEDSNSLHSVIPDESNIVNEFNFDIKQSLDILMDKIKHIITKKELKILLMRSGVGIYQKPHTLDEIGKEMHLTRERIRQIETRAIRKIRRSLSIRGIKSENFL